MARKTPLEAALHYRSVGISVIPVAQDKKPLLNWLEFTKRIAEKKEIETWFEKWPEANVGIVTGKISNLTVIDIEAGGQVDYLPQTKKVRTGGGGYHYYYKYSDQLKNKVRIRELTDIRNDGGYVVAPPSMHKSGTRYTVVSGSAEIQPFPIHLFLTETINQRKRKTIDELFTEVKKGERNNKAAQICGHILTKVPYSSWETIAWPALISWNMTYVEEPLEEDELRSVFESISKRVTYQQEDEEKELVTTEDLTIEYNQKIEDIKSGNINVIPTGFPTLDNLMNGGIRTKKYILIGARPSVGKTSIALSIAYNAAKQGKTVLFFSLEMSPVELYEKLLSYETKVTTTEIETGLGDPKKLEKGYESIKKLKILFSELANSTSVGVAEITKKIMLDKKIDLIVLDYIGLLADRTKSDNDQSRMSNISRNMKTLTKMTGIPLICLAQLNRKSEERKEKRPMISDLRESGSLEQDADVVILLRRDSDKDQRNVLHLEVAKNRTGPVGEFKANFDLRTTYVSEV